MKVGLFFGSFNPIHVGHLIIADSILQNSDLDEIYFVISPQNPFKEKKSLLHEFDRYDLVEKAIKGNDFFSVSDIEFGLPKPSYTIDTLIHLQEKYPAKSFSIIMGEDNLGNFHKWKNASEIIKNYEVYVYPRPFSKLPIKEYQNHSKIHKVEAPLVEISSTMIRKRIKENKSIKYLVSESVLEHIEKNKFYL